MYSSVFKRVEKKYRVSPAQRRAVEDAARPAMAVDAYGRTRITSLYLDTPGRALIARSVEKPLYKEKLRLRAYGDAAGRALMTAFAEPLGPTDDGAPLAASIVQACAARACEVANIADACAITVFFGIKKKFKGIVYKRRLALSLPAAVAFAGGQSYEDACTVWPLPDPEQAARALAPQTRQIARELTAAMDRHAPLVPSMGIACDREAWGVRQAAEVAPDAAGNAGGAAPIWADPDLRLTFDDRLEYFDCFRPADGWQPIIRPSESILEIKSAGPYPPWLVRALSAHSIYPASFTKYGNAYQLAGPVVQRKEQYA